MSIATLIMFSSGSSIKTSALALVTIAVCMLVGVVTANEKCVQEIGVFFGKCMDKAYLTAGLPPTHDHKQGDEALSELIHKEKNVVDGCKAKWQVATCVILKLCSSKECVFKDAELFEEQLKKELMPFVIPCKWDYKNLEVKHCTEDAWKAGHEKDNSFIVLATNGTSSTSTLNESTTAVPISINEQSITSTTDTFNTRESSIIHGNATTGNYGTTPFYHSSSNSTGEHSLTSNSFITDLEQTEIIYVAICCLVIFLFCCIFCCCCCASY